MKKILVVDDEKDARWVLSKIFKTEGFNVVQAENGQKALKMIASSPPDVVLLDIKMPGGMDGIEVLKRLQASNSDIQVIIMTAYGDIKIAVKAMKLGAYDFVTKPFEQEELLLTIERALEKQQLSQEVKELRNKLQSREQLELMMGTSEEIKSIYYQIERVAPTNFTVLIQGETGTGKELVARAIHNFNSSKGGSFVAVDCGAIPDTLVESELFGYEKGAFTDAQSVKEGQFEVAHKGTLFLDEIGNLPYEVQRKLLRVLQERKVQKLGAKKTIPVDVRIIAASNSTLAKHVENGEFRADLYYRINEFSINMPPLRNRKEDIPILAERFLQETRKELNKRTKGFSNEAIKSLLLCDWKGNVRELRNVVRRAVLLCEDIIEPSHLILDDVRINCSGLEDELTLDREAPLKDITKRVLAKVEKKAIENTMQMTKGNKSKAATILQIDYKTLLTKIKNYGIKGV